MIDLKILQPGDIIDYRSYNITPTSIEPGNILTAYVVGTTEGGALIKSSKIPGLTICVQTHNIIAARRKAVVLYPEPELFHAPDVYQPDHSDSSEHLWWYPDGEEK